MSYLDLMIKRFEGGFRGCADGCSGSASWDSHIDGNCLTPYQAQLHNLQEFFGGGFYFLFC